MNFFEKVYAVTRAIPYGQVATYGQIAAALGQPRSARMVGIALSKCAQSDVPWQRVINRFGMISIENMDVTKQDQARLLADEGVEVRLEDNNYVVDLSRYLVSNDSLAHAVS